MVKMGIGVRIGNLHKINISLQNFSNNKYTTIFETLTCFYLQLLSVDWFYKGLSKKPHYINQPQEWEKRKASCTKEQKKTLLVGYL